MNKVIELIPEFNDFPEEMEYGKLYISMSDKLTKHLCPCGCGGRVFVDLFPERGDSPGGWKMVFDGYVTLYPSIGNSLFECKSHYYVVQNKIVWCDDSYTGYAL